MDNTSRIGIDIEGVIRSKTAKSRTIDEYLAATPLKNAARTIKSLVKLFGSDNIFIISRCPEYAENVIIRWLDDQKFFTDINFNRSNVYFCQERLDKSDIARQLELTYFIDDRIDVLDNMKNIVANRILFTGGSNHHDSEIDNNIITLDSWDSVLEYIKR
ncbi:MAG: hypothetical protein WBI29_02490 [Candidatus Saccharimonadales bacterium]